MPILYRHIRLDTNMPFYIGISQHNQRAYSKKRNNIWWKIVKKTKYIVEIIYEHDDINLIKRKEEEFIKLYGRIDNQTGTLANMTNGGESNSGKIISKETKEKLSKYRGEIASFWGRKHTEETKLIISLKTKNTKSKGISDETRLNMSNAQKRRKDVRKGFPLSDEAKAKISATKKGRISYIPNEFQKKNASDRMKNYWIKNEDKKRFGENNVSKREDVRAKISKASSGENNAMYGMKGEFNPYFGKKHSIESINKISNSRKGKCLGEENPSKRADVRDKIRQKKIEYWKNKKKEKNEKRME